jgi:hypothetical protein
MRRTLALRKETLTALDTDELAAVAGGSRTCVTFTVVPTGCNCTGAYPTLNIDCPATRLTDELIQPTLVCTV